MAKNTKRVFDDDFDYSEVSYKEDRKESVVYNPQAKDTKRGTYSAYIRFVPFMKEPDKKKHLVTVYSSYLRHSSLNGKGKTVHSYRSIGEEKTCKIVKAFFDCHNSEDARIKNKKSMFVQKPEHYALVQILKDEQNPQLEGQIKVFKFKKQLKDLFDMEDNPPMGEEKRSPFNPYSGRVLKLYLTTTKDDKGNEFNDYTKCAFMGESESARMPLLIDGKPIDDYDSEDKKFVRDWLIENSPDLSAFAFKPWDEETRTFVDAVIQEQLGRGSASADLESFSKGSKNTGGGFDDIEDDDDEDVVVVKKSSGASKPQPAKKKVELDDEEDEDEMDYDADEKPLAKKSPAPAAKKKVVEDDDDEDDFNIDDMDMDL